MGGLLAANEVAGTGDTVFARRPCAASPSFSTSIPRPQARNYLK